MAEELGQPHQAAEAPEARRRGLSDSAVRVMIDLRPLDPPRSGLPRHRRQGKDRQGRTPTNIVIPARRRARRRSSVATPFGLCRGCDLHDLEKANFDALMKASKARHVWSTEQMLFIQALHTSAASYFAGSVKITEETGGQGRSQEAADGAGRLQERESRAPRSCRAGGDRVRARSADLLARAKGEGDPTRSTPTLGGGSTGPPRPGRAPAGGYGPGPGRASGRNAAPVAGGSN